LKEKCANITLTILTQFDIVDRNFFIESDKDFYLKHKMSVLP